MNIPNPENENGKTIGHEPCRSPKNFYIRKKGSDEFLNSRKTLQGRGRAIKARSDKGPIR